jgi:hypothetical protein
MSQKFTRRSPAIRILGAAARLIPGDYLRTLLYRGLIAKPRRALRKALHDFYRVDHVYDVLEEVRANYRGTFSILEFGTNQGYALVKMLYATEYLGMAGRVTVHGFDTFEGLPPAANQLDRSALTSQDVFFTGQFHGDYEALDALCRKRYGNYALHRGLFEDSLTPTLLSTFETQVPILVWLDCDYYSSTRTALERLLPYLPSGCVVYFDDIEALNYGSRLTGQARVIHELNQGAFGGGMELVRDRRLSLDTDRVYRFIRLEGGPRYERTALWEYNPGRAPTGGSPLP